MGREAVPLDDERRARYAAKKAHYQDPAVVAGYDAARFAHGHAARSTERKWRALRRVLGGALGPGARVLDVPCGTGRFSSRLLGTGCELVGADLSHAMLVAARAAAPEGTGGRLAGLVRADAEHLPFADDSFDLVLSIRFLFHVPPPLRAGILAEMARVSRRHVVVDVRHRYCVTTHTKRLAAWWRGERPPSPRASLAEVDADLAAAGLRLVRRVWLAPLLSEKMLVVAEKIRPGERVGSAGLDR